MKLNSVSGLWQYLALLWEYKLNKSEFLLSENSATQGEGTLLESINDCMKEMDCHIVKAIADEYNNENILQIISEG